MDKITLLPHHISFTSDTILSSTLYFTFHQMLELLISIFSLMSHDNSLQHAICSQLLKDKSAVLLVDGSLVIPRQMVVQSFRARWQFSHYAIDGSLVIPRQMVVQSLRDRWCHCYFIRTKLQMMLPDLSKPLPMSLVFDTCILNCNFQSH